MKESKFTNEQIAFALRRAETGTKVSEVCRKIRVAEATFYNWKKGSWEDTVLEFANSGTQECHGT